MIVWYDIGKEGPAPHGAGGLKFLDDELKERVTSPAPHGAGGLKFEHINGAAGALIVPPRTGRVD